jgi:hypothetical protein
VTDWAAVATAADFTTAKYARDTWTGVKKKLAAVTAAKPARKTQAGDGDDEAEVGDDAAPVTVPTKRGRGRPPGKATLAKRKGKSFSSFIPLCPVAFVACSFLRPLRFVFFSFAHCYSYHNITHFPSSFCCTFSSDLFPTCISPSFLCTRLLSLHRRTFASSLSSCPVTFVAPSHIHFFCFSFSLCPVIFVKLLHIHLTSVVLSSYTRSFSFLRRTFTQSLFCFFPSIPSHVCWNFVPFLFPFSIPCHSRHITIPLSSFNLPPITPSKPTTH